jgi:hypothetical protein
VLKFFVNLRAKEEREAVMSENVALKKELADTYTRHLVTYLLMFLQLKMPRYCQFNGLDHDPDPHFKYDVLTECFIIFLKYRTPKKC